QQAIDLVADVAETARLRSVAVDGQGIALQRLFHEVGNDPSIVNLHARTIRVKNARNACLHVVIAAVGSSCCFRKTLGLVVDGTRPDGVYMPPIGFFLWMFEGIPVAL